MPGNKRQVLIAYVPVLHKGYKFFFEKYKNSELLIIGSDLLSEFDHLARGKDVRMLSPEDVFVLVSAWGIFSNVRIAEPQSIEKLREIDVDIIANRDDVLEEILQKYLPGKEIIWDSTFLRWEKKNVTGETVITPNQIISQDQFDKEMMCLAQKESDKSKDWWRKVGALVVKDDKVLASKYNQYVPTISTPYFEGDPRSNFTAGVRPDLSLVMHAEAGIIAEAAKNGIALEGASMYCTTFPCPVCAKQVAYSGIKKLYYSKGYAVLDGERILKDKGVEIIFVDVENKKAGQH